MALVRGVRGTTIILASNAAPECLGCTATRWCGSPEHRFEAENPQGYPLSEGDRVEVELASSDATRAGLAIILLPLLSFFLSFLVGGWLIEAPATPLAGLIGIGGMAAGFGAALLLHRRHRSSRLPQIVTHLPPQP